MNRKISISTFAGALSLLSTMNISHAEESWTTYIGAHAGYQTLRATQFRNAAGTGASSIGDQDKGHLSTDGVNGGIYIGVGLFPKFYKPLFFGLEASGTLSNLEATDIRATAVKRASDKLSLKQGQSFALSLRTGILLNNSVLPYFKVGVASTRWKVESSYNFLAIRNPYAKTERYLTGLIIGVGVDIPVTKNLVFGLEGNHTRYQEINHFHPNVNPADVNFNLRPNTTSINLRLSWKM